MRILLACQLYHPSVGGVQEVVRQVAERLVLRGHQVTVATSRLPERRIRSLNGVDIVEFDVDGNAVRGLSGDVAKYRRFVLAGDYDVLMVKAAQQWTFDALVPVMDLVPAPKIFVPCGFSALHEPAYADYYREIPALLAKFDHLIFYASDYRDINMARDHQLGQFSIVPNGASEREFGVPRDPGFRRRIGIDEAAFVILTVGTLTGGMKGHRELARAFELADFGDRPSVLILNGNVYAAPRAPIRRTLLKSMRGYARRLLRRRRAVSAGADSLDAIVAQINKGATRKRAVIVDLNRDNLVQAYMNSDLFAFASNIEYSPLVLYEAAAAGLPFLTVPVGNAAEIAEWTGGGLVCPAPVDDRGYTRVDPVVLADHLGRLAADGPRLQALGQAGHNAWLQRFTWETIAGQYESIFRDVVERTQA
ncbi:MAG: glycosyltransferase family 4 protein [Chloroflexi bacterium]|nr:glycosyltransferase family 4 protein [Chloroflexota bacterium]